MAMLEAVVEHAEDCSKLWMHKGKRCAACQALWEADDRLKNYHDMLIGEDQRHTILRNRVKEISLN